MTYHTAYTCGTCHATIGRGPIKAEYDMANGHHDDDTATLFRNERKGLLDMNSNEDRGVSTGGSQKEPESVSIEALLAIIEAHRNRIDRLEQRVFALERAGAPIC